MSEFNKSYRIRTEVGKDKNVIVNLNQNYDTLEIMSLKINQENAYRLHTSDYGVITGRVLANGAFGIPNAKISVFINRDENDANDTIKSILYPYNTTNSKDKNGIRYNLLPNEQVNNCHTIIGTFPEKQFALDNDSVLEVFEKYYKYTTKTNDAGDYMIFGAPVGTQTIHVDIDLSDIGILSQKPRDMVYKGYNINQFENPNKYKYDTNLNSLTQVISQDSVTEVIPFWGDENDNTIGITRCDIDIQYKFETTCVFMGSVVSDMTSNAISKKCIPSPGMGAMDELTTGSGTIEMIRKTPDGKVEEFQVQGTQLINGDGVWCYQIPMNLDYMMTDEFGNMVPTNNPNKGIATRTRVRFRISMQDFDNNDTNNFRAKMLVPHNPANEDELDYQFGTSTKESSYRDLFWNGVYSVKSYIPRIQKGSNWRNEKFTGFKRVNYYGDKNPIPYNNIRIKIPFMYSIMCALIKLYIIIAGICNRVINIVGRLVKIINVDADNRAYPTYVTIDATLCDDNLERVCIIPGIKLQSIGDDKEKTKDRHKINIILKTVRDFIHNIGGNTGIYSPDDDSKDEESIDYRNKVTEGRFDDNQPVIDKGSYGKNDAIKFKGINITTDVKYLIQCIEMHLAEEYRVVQFDFYNDWINGLLYIPRWSRNISRKHTFLFGLIKFGGKVKACNEDFGGNGKKRNLVQQCGLSYNINTNEITNKIGCSDNGKLLCHKNKNVRLEYPIFKQTGLIKSIKTLKNQYVYYFKPFETERNKVIKLFSSDIILLGTLNECDKWGISNDLKNLLSSTYQLPTNLALTDSDVDGRRYEALGKTGYSSARAKHDINGTLKWFSWGTDVINSINIMLDDGNYTELSGIDWGYNGPLQMTNVSNVNDLYKPGGHFLGLSCRNSETTIKSCVNLTRICEYGVWMSQRQELNVPTNDNKVKNIATVPTGLISKDEISDTNFREIFATLNSNKLKTTIDNKTGFPVYEFIYIKPTNFGGELSKHLENQQNFNGKVTDRVEERYYTYKDDDNNRINTSAQTTTNEIQIRRTGEFRDEEYLKYRFGLTSEEIKSSGFKNKYLQSGGNNTYSFPMYENSFYFYFGLHDGKTAIDEFKKNYYSVCEKNKNLIQIDNSIRMANLEIEYDGITVLNNGKITFKVKANEAVFGENGIKVNLQNINGGKTTTLIAVNSTDDIIFDNLEKGEYIISFETHEGKYENTFNVIVENVNITGEIRGVDFINDVTNDDINSKIKDSRLTYGGYIVITNNMLDKILDNKDKENIDIFSDECVKNIIIKDDSGNTICYNTKEEPLNFYYSNIDDTITIENDNEVEYKIPVPNENFKYFVYVSTYITNGKPSGKTLKSQSHEWLIGSVYINNGKIMDIRYNGISYSDVLIKYASGTTDINSTNGWWNPENNSGWLNEDEKIQWDIKTSLYQNDNNIPHTVSIENFGGTPPYTEIVGGENLVGADVTRNDFEVVNVPTINFNNNGKRRSNFSYQIKDNNGQVYPKQPFIFPVIYKPFFMEMGIWYFDEVKKYYLYGNVYNGKTWNYQTEGYNDVKLNNVNITNLTTITKNDTIMEINEVFTNETGGYDYIGEYNKYNGRKTTVLREIEPITYDLSENKVINNLSLSIGCSHTGEGVEISDNTNEVRNKLKFFNFELITKNINGNYYVKMDVIGSDSNSYKLYVVYDNDNKIYGYDYPISNTGVFKSENNSIRELLYDLMNNNIKNINVETEMIDGEDGFININKISNGKIFYIATPDNNHNDNSIVVSRSNDENKLYGISISSCINLDTLSKFYPLDILASCKDTLNENGSYKTLLTITPKDESVNNFIGKTFELHFYKKIDNVKIPTQTITCYSSNDKIETDITVYRNLLGLNNENTTLYFDYDVYIGEEKSPTSYLNNEVNVEFIDNTITTEQQ